MNWCGRMCSSVEEPRLVPSLKASTFAAPMSALCQSGHSTSVSLSSVRCLLTQSVTRSQKWSRENSFQQAANYRRGPERQFDR